MMAKVFILWTACYLTTILAVPQGCHDFEEFLCEHAYPKRRNSIGLDCPNGKCTTSICCLIMASCHSIKCAVHNVHIKNPWDHLCTPDSPCDEHDCCVAEDEYHDTPAERDLHRGVVIFVSVVVVIGLTIMYIRYEQEKRAQDTEHYYDSKLPFFKMSHGDKRKSAYVPRMSLEITRRLEAEKVVGKGRAKLGLETKAGKGNNKFGIAPALIKQAENQRKANNLKEPLL